MVRKKTKITTTPNGRVVISYDDALTGERITREFLCPMDGGYVREVADGWPQVCRYLDRSGHTLEASSRDALPALIRREYKLMRAAEARMGFDKYPIVPFGAASDINEGDVDIITIMAEMYRKSLAAGGARDAYLEEIISEDAAGQPNINIYYIVGARDADDRDARDAADAINRSMAGSGDSTDRDAVEAEVALYTKFAGRLTVEAVPGDEDIEVDGEADDGVN